MNGEFSTQTGGGEILLAQVDSAELLKKIEALEAQIDRERTARRSAEEKQAEIEQKQERYDDLAERFAKASALKAEQRRAKE